MQAMLTRLSQNAKMSTPSSFHRNRHLALDFTLLDEHGLARDPTLDEFESSTTSYLLILA